MACGLPNRTVRCGTLLCGLRERAPCVPRKLLTTRENMRSQEDMEALKKRQGIKANDVSNEVAGSLRHPERAR